jgi:ribonuclease-3
MAYDSTASLPYNIRNNILTLDDLKTILGKDYKPINNINTFRNAFLHRSYCTRKNENFVNGNIKCPEKCLPLQEESNERLEFLGDAVLNLIVGQYLFERYPDENEGFLTKMRTKLVNGNMLAHMAEILNLGKYVIISKQVEDNNGRKNKNLLEDCFEALLGAMFIDSQNNIEKVYNWLVNFIEVNIDFTELITMNTNYKDIVMKHYQHTQCFTPKFYALDTETKNNTKIYYVCLKNNKGEMIAKGSGNTKKQAENECAKHALIACGINPTKGIN